jgi:TonB-linked SusC/RagA family outer membrane protein
VIPHHITRWSDSHVGPVFLMRLTVLICLLCVTVSSTHAQQTMAVDMPHNSATVASDVLARPVTVRLDRVLVRRAVAVLAASAKVRIQYQAQLLDTVTTLVTLHAADMPLGTAFDRVLAGTRLRAVPLASDFITIKPTSEAAGWSTETGVIAGIVTDAATGKPLNKATVTVRGTKLTTLTDARGMYAIPDVPAGKCDVTARLLGYGAAVRVVVVPADDTVRVSFALSTIAARLDEVVTTVTGDQKRLEMGNSIATIDAASIVPTTPIRNLSDLLNGRAPGMTVLSTSGAVGSGSQVRIRGVSSLTGSSDPIVIVDGVRLDASFSQPVPGTTPQYGIQYSAATNQASHQPATSRLNDIDPESIETIEVLKGPSAATLYGSDAANGVIVITTKKGRPGPTRWTFFGQDGTSHMDATFPDAWHGWGTWPSDPGNLACSLLQMGNGYCTQDSVTHYNPLNHKETSPLGTGSSSKYGVQVSGGTQTLQYFLGSDYDDETGLFQMPSFDESSLVAQRDGTPLPGWALRPNTLSALHLTSKLTAQLASTADVSLSSDFLHQYHRDDGTSSYILSSILSAGYPDSATQGWGQFGSPVRNFLQRSSDVVDRGNGGLSGNWHPTSYLSGRGTAGVDYTNRTDDAYQPTDALPNALGSRTTALMTNVVRTLDVGTTLDVPLLPSVRSRASVGGQYTRTDVNGTNTTGNGLAEGSDVINGATTVTASQYNSALAVAGWYVEEVLSLNDRAFLTAALRGDASSSFGTDAKAVYYPKWSASWLVSQEPFFPRIVGLNDLRLRAAFGHAGVQPAFDARFRSYRDSTGFVDNTSVSGLLLSTVGNPALRPERSTELEGGFDLGMWADRLTMEFTLYNKITRDALVDRALPPSLGAASRQENIGKVRNSGLEFSATMRPVVSPLLDWTLTMSVSQNRNKLLTLGQTTLPPLPSGGVGTVESRYVVGYPLGGFWEQPLLGYADVNGDGVIDLSEVRVGDTAVYRGQPFPKIEMSWHNDLSFFSGRFTVGAGFNYTGGLTQLDAALWAQANNGVSQGQQDLGASLLSQAYAVAGEGSNGQGTTWGYLERVSYVRLSELSLTFAAPPSLVRKLHARTANLSIMGRNLALWSSYHGADPEVNSNILANQILDDGGVPQPRDWSVRVNLGF